MSRVVDTLPKHWGGRGSAAIPEQLTAKANSHSVLLDTLQHAGVLEQMPPSALRCFEDCGALTTADRGCWASAIPAGLCMLVRQLLVISKRGDAPGRTDACWQAITHNLCPSILERSLEIRSQIISNHLLCRVIFDVRKNLHAVAATRETYNSS